MIVPDVTKLDHKFKISLYFKLSVLYFFHNMEISLYVHAKRILKILYLVAL